MKNMKESEIIRSIIERLINAQEDCFEELTWLFREYSTAKLVEEKE